MVPGAADASDTPADDVSYGSDFDELSATGASEAVAEAPPSEAADEYESDFSGDGGSVASARGGSSSDSYGDDADFEQSPAAGDEQPRAAAHEPEDDYSDEEFASVGEPSARDAREPAAVSDAESYGGSDDFEADAGSDEPAQPQASVGSDDYSDEFD